MLTRTGKLVIAGGVVGLLLVIVGIVIDHGPGIVMKKSVPIVDRPSSKSFPAWSKPSLPIFMKFYFFNVTNVDEVMKGEAPVVSEVGPFVYREEREKIDITFNEDNSEVSYREKISFFFDESQSAGSEDEEITAYNLAYTTTISALLDAKRKGNRKAGVVVRLLNGKVNANKIKLFSTTTVKGMLWGQTDPFLDLVWKNKKFSEKVKTNQFGLFLGRNGTAGDKMTIGTGIHSLDDFAKVKEYKDNTTLEYWYTGYANAINGTDGSMFSPFVNKNENLYMFSPDLCRSIMAEFKKVETIHGLKTYHYGPSASVFAGPDENPDNVAFCYPDGKEESCLGKGLLRVSECKKQAPLVVSSPHLLGADPAKAAMIKGLNPDPERHVTKLNIEPNTGLLLEANKRIQYNVLITRVRGQTIFGAPLPGGVKDQTVLPLFWVEEGVQATEAFAEKLGKVPKLIAMCRNLMLALVAIGAMLLLGCLLAAFVQHDRLWMEGASKPVPTTSPDEKYQNVKYTPN